MLLLLVKSDLLADIDDQKVVEEWADQTGGLKTLCIQIGYGEPTRVESREGSSGLAESSRVT